MSPCATADLSWPTISGDIDEGFFMKKAVIFLGLCLLFLTNFASAESLTTTYSGGNGQRGVMFDVVALQGITITNVDHHLYVGANSTVEIYGKSGSHVGSQDTPGDWVLLGTASNLVSVGDGIGTPIPINLNIALSSGDIYSLYITTTSVPAGSTYTGGTTLGAVYAQDANLQILEGRGKNYPFGLNFVPRVWNGTIHYSTIANIPAFGPFGLLASLGALLWFGHRRK